VSNAPSKPVSFSRPKVGYFSNRPRIIAMCVPGSSVGIATGYGLDGRGIEWECGSGSVV
jgi:hypothetical protein